PALARASGRNDGRAGTSAGSATMEATPSRGNRRVPELAGLVAEPGRAPSGRPRCAARAATVRGPEREPAPTMTAAPERPPRMRLRVRTRHLVGAEPGAISLAAHGERTEPCA